jgi:hypothetical protein
MADSSACMIEALEYLHNGFDLGRCFLSITHVNLLSMEEIWLTFKG